MVRQPVKKFLSLGRLRAGKKGEIMGASVQDAAAAWLTEITINTLAVDFDWHLMRSVSQTRPLCTPESKVLSGSLAPGVGAGDALFRCGAEGPFSSTHHAIN